MARQDLRRFPYLPLTRNCECEACQQWTLIYYDPGITYPYGELTSWMSAQPAEQSLCWCPSARALRHNWAWIERQRALRKS